MSDTNPVKSDKSSTATTSDLNLGQKTLLILRENKGFILFLILLFMMRSSIADWSSVPTGSMKPTIIEGDRIWIDKLAYDVHVPFTHISLHRFGDPQRGEIAIFDSEVEGNRLVKRIIGLPGDTVMVRNNLLTLNGEQAVYTSLDQAIIDEVPDEGALTQRVIYRTETVAGISHPIRVIRGYPANDFGPIKVPEGHYFVMGDNRDESKDARKIGFVPRDEFVGRSESVVLSLDYEDWYLPRKSRWFYDLP